MKKAKKAALESKLPKLDKRKLKKKKMYLIRSYHQLLLRAALDRAAQLGEPARRRALLPPRQRGTDLTE